MPRVDERVNEPLFKMPFGCESFAFFAALQGKGKTTRRGSWTRSIMFNFIKEFIDERRDLAHYLSFDDEMTRLLLQLELEISFAFTSIDIFNISHGLVFFVVCASRSIDRIPLDPIRRRLNPIWKRILIFDSATSCCSRRLIPLE